MFQPIPKHNLIISSNIYIRTVIVPDSMGKKHFRIMVQDKEKNRKLISKIKGFKL